MSHDNTNFYCNTEALQTGTPTCIQLHESYIHTTDTTLEAELAVCNLKLTPTMLTTCKLQYSNGNLKIPDLHNTYNDTINDTITTRDLKPTDIFYLYNDLIIVQLLKKTIIMLFPVGPHTISI